jgi:methionine-rich copper-binding protein CopC
MLRITRRWGVTLLALACAGIAAAPASGHVGVKSYSPKRGSTVARPLERVKVTFKGRITDGKLTVRNASGGKVSIGKGRVVSGDRVLRVRLKSGLAGGRYRVSMQVLHTDGHVMSKAWTFNLK